MLFPEPGKRKSQCSLGAMSAGMVDKLLFIEDAISNRCLLVDLGTQEVHFACFPSWPFGKQT